MVQELNDIAVLDSLSALRKKEKCAYKCSDYLRSNADLLKSTEKSIDASCRAQMCIWCYHVVDFCKFQHDTVATAMSNLDRFSATDIGSSALTCRRQYQLAAITALYTTSKVLETKPLQASLLAKLSKGFYSENDIFEMELTLLKALEWRITGPTSSYWFRCFLLLLPDSVEPAVEKILTRTGQRQIELSLAEYSLVTLPRSDIALAAMLNAMDEIGPVLFPFNLQKHFLDSIQRCSGISVDTHRDTQKLLNYLYVASSGTDDIQVNVTENSSVASTKATTYKDDCKSPVSTRNMYTI